MESMNQTIINLLELSYTSYDTQTVKAVT